MTKRSAEASDDNDSNNAFADVFGQDSFFVTRYEEALAGLLDERFSASVRTKSAPAEDGEKPATPEEFRPFERSLLQLDPPDHTRLRALVHDGLEAKQAVKTGTNEITLDSWLEYGSQRVPLLYQEVLKGKVETFAQGPKDVYIDADLSGENSSLKKPSAFQQPSLFNFQKNKQDVQLQ